MNENLKMVVITNDTPRRTIWMTQFGAAIRTFETEREARDHARLLETLTGHQVLILPLEY